MSQCVKIVFLQNIGLSKMRFWKRNLHFSFFLLENRNKNAKNKTIKIGFFFFLWSSKNVKNQKNRFLTKIAWHYLCRERRKTRIFVATIYFCQNFFWTKTMQNKKHYKNRGFNGNCKKKNKNDTFFGKKCFLTWLKKWVLLTVFLKSCVFLKTLFYSVFSKTQLFKNKNYMFKKTKNYEK